MAGLSVEFPAKNQAVGLDEMKNFLRVDDIDADDDLIRTLIDAATISCENYCRRSFINKGFIQTLDAFPYFTDTMLSQLAYPPSYYALPKYSTTLWNYSQMIKVWRPPLVSVDRITYMDSGLSSFKDLVGQPLPWYPQKVYQAGQQCTDSNGNVQTLIPLVPSVLNSGKSGITPPGDTGNPPWGKNLGDITVERTPATAVWQNGGPLPKGEFGSFIVDNTSEPARIFPGFGNKQTNNGYWPSVLYIPNAVQIHFTAGYGDNSADVPANIRTAIMMAVSDFYENREPQKGDEEQLPRHVRALLWPSRVMDFSPTRG